MVLLALFVTACAPAKPAAESGAVSNPTVENVQPTQAGVGEPVPTQVVVEGVEPTLEPTQVVVENPTPRPVRTELEASDPGSVQLAAGKVQFVEFFAFW